MRIVSFSGIDGAGKTTQISAFEARLREAGLTSKLITFWDDIVVFPGLREFMSRVAFKGDQGIGSPEKPLHRRDKNVTSWYLLAVRFFLYFADAINARRKIGAMQKVDTDVVIFDRYIYDELANLSLDRWPARIFVRLTLKVVRKPDVAFLIDADPVAARARKPEYPLEFLRINREAYLTLARLTGNMTVIEPLPIGDAGLKVIEAFLLQVSAQEAACPRLPALG